MVKYPSLILLPGGYVVLHGSEQRLHHLFQVDDYGDLTEMILQATKVAEKFDSFCKAYKIK